MSGYKKEGRPWFNPLHTDQYCVFLHYLREEAKTLEAASTLGDKLFCLNKMLHSVDFYSASLPDYFMLTHPLGSIIGRAVFGDGQGHGHCLMYQQVTIGGNYGRDGLEYPVIGNHIIFYAKSSVIGAARIGDYSILALGAVVKDEVVPPHSLVFGSSPNLVIKPLAIERYFELSPYLPD